MPELKPLPCPECGDGDCLLVARELGVEEYRVHCGCGHTGRYCASKADAITAHNAIPRSLRWTTEPPKVAGFFWHIGGVEQGIYSGVPGIMNIYMHNGEFGYCKNGEFCSKLPEGKWAGPIPAPAEG